MAKRSISVAMLSFAVFGCGDPHPLMPLSVGRTITYVARFGFEERVESVRVNRALSIAGTQGYELTGALGVSRLGWVGPILYTDQAANATFEPSLPILNEGTQKEVWHGRVVSMGIIHPATATIERPKDEVTIDCGGRQYKTTESTVTIKMGKATLELVSWFERGTGLVQQEQRTNGTRIMQIQLVSAPID